MYDDPYLKKRRDEEAEIKRQIEKALADQKKSEIVNLPKPAEPYLGEFVPGPNGLLLPIDLDPCGTGCGPWAVKADAVPKELYSYPVYTTGPDDLKKALKYAASKIFDGVFSPLPGCNCPACNPGAWKSENPHEREHRILRAYHGDRAEYVYSETLKAHVRIGEPLKEKHA